MIKVRCTGEKESTVASRRAGSNGAGVDPHDAYRRDATREQLRNAGEPRAAETDHAHVRLDARRKANKARPARIDCVPHRNVLVRAIRHERNMTKRERCETPITGQA